MNRRGFTLIELLVVISIVSLLSSVVLSQIKIAQKKSTETAAVKTLEQLKITLDLYYDKYGKYPPTPTGTTDDARAANYGLTCWNCGGTIAPRDPNKLSSISEFLTRRPDGPPRIWQYCSDSYGYFYKVSPSGQGYKLALACAIEYGDMPTVMLDASFGLAYTASIYAPESAKTWQIYTLAGDLTP